MYIDEPVVSELNFTHNLCLALHLIFRPIVIKASPIGMFVCVDAIHPSIQFVSHDRKISCLPGLNQYKKEEKVSYQRTQYIATGEARTSNPSVSS